MSFAHSLMHTVSAMVRRNRSLSRWALKLVPDCHVHITVPHIGKLRVRLRRNRSLWLRPPLTHEWYPLAALKALVRPSDKVWDVGANIGLYARWLSSHLHARHVYSFEPMSANLPELRYNIEKGGVADRVTIVPCALSNQDGEVEFQVDDMQSASGAVDAVYQGEACRARSALGLPPLVEKVPSRTIDAIQAAGDLPMPDVLKIDVEGAERLLLDGGTRFFREASPRLVIETHGLAVSRQCLHFLFDHGYTVAACVRPEVHPTRHMRLDPSFIDRMTSDYDAHFIIASKNPGDIPHTLDYQKL
jgi:FkbM family methyltransferase